MSFSEAVKSVFNKYATFSGRARRSEYWYFILLQIIVSIVFSLVWSFVNQNVGQILDGVWTLATLVPSLSVMWRRLHDIGKSGAWFFISLTGIGAIVLLVWLCKDSDAGENQYGPNPKAA